MVAALVVAIGCGGGSDKDPDAAIVDAQTIDAGDGGVGDGGAADADLSPVQARLSTTLNALAAFGQKRAGTPAANLASQYVFDQFTALGLSNVHFETFKFPRFVLGSSSLAVTANGTPLSMPHDVLAYSGSGTADRSAAV